MKAKTKVSRLFVILLALVMVVGLLPTTALAEEPDAFLQFADAPGEFFYDISGGYNSEGPTVDTIFTLTEPTMITGIWTYHWNAANYDIDFSRQTIQLKDTATDTVVYSGAVRVGHYANTRDCDWIVLPNIVLPAGTYQVIDSHNESWCALNSKGVCMVKGYSISYTVSFDADGGTGEMEAATGVWGDYTLPANGFTAPEGKQFKAWSVNGTEKAVGDKIAVAADTTVKAVWENIPAAPTEYDILDGANSSWTQDSDGSLSIRGSGAFSEFVGVKVDRTLVDAKYYTVKEGSTIVTLKADYLNTCTVGSHTLEIVWTDGSASTTFSVNAKSPQTGDNSMMWIWIALLFVSGIGVMGTTIYIRKKKYSVK